MSAVKNPLEALKKLAEQAEVAEPTVRSGRNGQEPRSTTELLGIFDDVLTAPSGRLPVNGKAHELSDEQIAAVIIKQDSVGKAAAAISLQSRYRPTAAPDVLTRFAMDYSPNRNTITGLTVEAFGNLDQQYTGPNEDPIAFCRAAIDHERGAYDAIKELVNTSVLFIDGTLADLELEPENTLAGDVEEEQIEESVEDNDQSESAAPGDTES